MTTMTTHALHNGTTMVRVDKRAARKLFIQGADVTLVPNKLLPFGGAGWDCTINSNDYPTDAQTDNFDYRVGLYARANCNGETGRYVSFYVRDTDRSKLWFKPDTESRGMMG